jgi:hypothetical protein
MEREAILRQARKHVGQSNKFRSSQVIPVDSIESLKTGGFFH